MIDASPSLEAAKGISGRELLVYLEGKGWKARPSKVDGISIVSKEFPGANERAEFIVPIKAGFSDEQRRIADALRTIAQIDGCSEAEIASKVKEAKAKSVASISPKSSESERRTKGNFWVIGSEFGSMNFHKLVEGSAQVQGPFKTRKEAEDAWRVVSEENRHKAGVRFSIIEEPSSVSRRTGSPLSRG